MAADVDPLHPFGRCTCGNTGKCNWCRVTEIRELIAEYEKNTNAIGEPTGDLLDFYWTVSTIVERE